MSTDVERHRELMLEAIALDGEAQRALLAGDGEASRIAFARASVRYRSSWEAAPPRSYGRLVGMLKSSILAGDAMGAATYARAALTTEDEPLSPPAAYVVAVAALVQEDDNAARRAALQMRAGSEEFVRTADAVAALVNRDAGAYATALAAIVRDFEDRDAHLTGVRIADTAIMLERLAAPRGLTASPISPVVG